jgi:hypothetical protein
MFMLLSVILCIRTYKFLGNNHYSHQFFSFIIYYFIAQKKAEREEKNENTDVTAPVVPLASTLASPSASTGYLLLNSSVISVSYLICMLTHLLMPLAGLHFCVGLDFVTPSL